MFSQAVYYILVCGFMQHPNNLEQLKTYADTSLKTMKEWYSENGLKMNSNKIQ